MNLDCIRSEAMRLETTVNIYFKCNVNYDDTCKDNAFAPSATTTKFYSNNILSAK